MLHAIAIETTERDHFRWRVFIPETPTFYLHDLPFDVPKTDIPQYVEYRGGKPLRPGEHIFDMRIKPALGRDDAVIALMSDRSDEGYGGTEVLIEERKVDWINTKYSPQRIENYYRGVSLTQMTVSPEEPLVLIRMRACRVEITERKPDGKPSSWHFEAIEEPTDGLMMWINQYENEKDVPMHLRNSP